MGQAMPETGRLRGWLGGTLMAFALAVAAVALAAMGQALVSAMESGPAAVSEAESLAPDFSVMQPH